MRVYMRSMEVWKHHIGNAVLPLRGEVPNERLKRNDTISRWEFTRNGITTEKVDYVLVHEDDRAYEDQFISDPGHHSLCWGSCYRLDDVNRMLKRNQDGSIQE